MKKILLLFIIFNSTVFSQGGWEIIVSNFTTHNNTIKFKIYPVSMIFNGTNEYNLLARQKNSSLEWQYYYLSGVAYDVHPINPELSIKKTDFTLNQGQDITINADADVSGNDCHLGFGLGKYRVDVWWDNNILTQPPDESFTIEYDPGYYTCPRPPFSPDLSISFRDNTNNPNVEDPRMEFAWASSMANHPLKVRDVGYKIEAWNQYQNGTREKEFGDFHYSTGTSQIPNVYTVIPQDPRRDCVPEVQPLYPEQNHLFNIIDLGNEIAGPSNVGLLTLKLTIDKNVSTPDYLSREPAYYYTVLPSPISIINSASLILSTGSGGERTFVFNTIQNTTIGTNLFVEGNGKFELLGTSTESNRAHVTFNSYCNSTFDAGSILNLGQNSKITLQGNSQMIWAHYTFVNGNAGTKIHLLDNSILNNCGATINHNGLNIHEQGGHVVFNPDACNWDNGGLPIIETINNGSYSLSNGSTLTLGANCRFVFDGPQAFLKAETGTSIILGPDAALEFINGAYLDADGCTFTSVNSGEIWEGILLDGAGSVTNIRNCTFSDAASSITVTNTICNIANNTFNISNNSSCVYGINAVNETNITIAGNTFNAGSNSVAECIRFFNYDGDGLPGGGGSSAYTLNIYNNTFNGSVNAIDIQCLTASQLPFYIANNSFYPAGSITSNGIYAYNITGNIKNNYFYNANSNKSLTLQFSTVNLFNNTLYSVNQNIWSSNSTLMQMAPVLNAFGQWLWYGGYNSLTSGSLQNIEFRSYSNPTIAPNGLNCFTVTTQPNFLGELCLGTKPYKAYDNFWSPTVSGSTFDITCNSNPVNLTYTPDLSTCSVFDPDGSTGFNVTDLTNGIYDTVYITSGGEGGSYPGNLKKTSNSADILYFEAIQKRKQRDYTSAINKCKVLINEHDTSSYFNSAMSELYLNYLESDTSGNQTITNGLFNNLKTYIEQKMQQYPNNAQFVERAYKYHLMCLVKVKSYTEAIAGYENIMNNHPDPIVRLNASWDRSAVVFMMGQGGSENDNSIKSSKSRNTKLLDKNPVHRIAKDIFREQKVQSEQMEKNISDEQLNNEDVSTVVYTKEEKQMLERRIENYNPTDKKDFMDKLSKDIKLIEQINTAKNTKKTNANVPRSFKLHQNYPNPFNPTTTIKYEIPKDAEITIKVYDLLGREVFSINEYKKAGSYEVKFDGANLASGMYLYSFETNGYKDTKKMVLLK
jgi:hypothetical protein